MKLSEIAINYFRTSREAKYEHCYNMINNLPAFIGDLARRAGEILRLEVATYKTRSGSDFTVVHRDGLVDVYLHWGVQASFFDDLCSWRSGYFVEGLNHSVIEILINEATVSHYGELQWMLEYYKERGVWTTPNAEALSKLLPVLKSLSSQLTMSGREWYRYSESGACKEVLVHLTYDVDMEAFIIHECHVESLIDTLTELASEIDIENDNIIPIGILNDFYHFEL